MVLVSVVFFFAHRKTKLNLRELSVAKTAAYDHFRPSATKVVEARQN